MRIGTLIFTWDECDRCIYFDEDHGCVFDGKPEIMADDDNNALVCLTGTTNEPDYWLDIDFEEPWE